MSAAPQMHSHEDQAQSALRRILSHRISADICKGSTLGQARIEINRTVGELLLMLIRNSHDGIGPDTPSAGRWIDVELPASSIQRLLRQNGVLFDGQEVYIGVRHPTLVRLFNGQPGPAGYDFWLRRLPGSEGNLPQSFDFGIVRGRAIRIPAMVVWQAATDLDMVEAMPEGTPVKPAAVRYLAERLAGMMGDKAWGFYVGVAETILAGLQALEGPGQPQDSRHIAEVISALHPFAMVGKSYGDFVNGTVPEVFEYPALDGQGNTVPAALGRPDFEKARALYAALGGKEPRPDWPAARVGNEDGTGLAETVIRDGFPEP